MKSRRFSVVSWPRSSSGIKTAKPGLLRYLLVALLLLGVQSSVDSVGQVHARLQLCPVRIDDRDRDDGDEAVERVELGETDLVLVHQGHTQGDLDEHGELDEAGEPPQGAAAQLRDPVRRQCPDAGEGVADDDDPRPRDMEVTEHETEHGHRGYRVTGP